MNAGAVAVYFEPAAVIVVLALLGQVLELRARGRTSAAIKSLLGLAPKTARLLKDDGAEEDERHAVEHVAEVKRRLRARPAGILPFSLGRELLSGPGGVRGDILVRDVPDDVVAGTRAPERAWKSSAGARTPSLSPK